MKGSALVRQRLGPRAQQDQDSLYSGLDVAAQSPGPGATLSKPINPQPPRTSRSKFTQTSSKTTRFATSRMPFPPKPAPNTRQFEGCRWHGVAKAAPAAMPDERLYPKALLGQDGSDRRPPVLVTHRHRRTPELEPDACAHSLPDCVRLRRRAT